MTVPIDAIIRAAISFSAPNSSVAQMVFWHILAGATAAEEDLLDDLSAGLVDGILTNWALIGADTAEAFLVEVDEMNEDGTVADQIGSDEISVFGSDSGHLLPSAAAAYMQADSVANKAKGKKYIPFLTENQSTESIWNAATLTRLAAMLINYLNPISITGGGTLLPGVLSRPLVAFQIFTGSGYTTDIPAYQRRRKPNVGS